MKEFHEIPEQESLQTEQIPAQGSAKRSLADRLRFLKAHAAEIAIYVRYLLPLISTLTLFLLSFFYNIKTATGGRIYEVALGKLLVNTLTGTHEYLGGEMAEAKTWFFGLLSAIAVLCILVYLIALFLAGLAAYTAVRALRLPEGSEESNRYKLIFKIAFPNRRWLFISNLLVLIPAAYPHFVSLVGSRFLAIGGENVIFILLNRPLIVVGGLVLVTLILAILIPRLERRKKMNMFLIRHEVQESEGEEPPEM
ncbi:MAG: hypothetical protein IJW22_04095 [Clostridia bacterium]|nr:hypothetical protein [Clostridia bacterium]